MGTMTPRTFQLKTGETLVVRPAEETDALSTIQIARSFLNEGECNITQPDEVDLTEAREVEWIKDFSSNPGKLALVAAVDGTVVGLADFEAGRRRRMSHSGLVSLIVGKEWRSRGVGTALLQSILDWAAAGRQIEKVALTVLASNERARGLYRKLGFVEEGRKVKEIKLAPGEYVDEILMYRFVKPEIAR
jgi:RimJ/RimL family protein N-acetyltransferase